MTHNTAYNITAMENFRQTLQSNMSPKVEVQEGYKFNRVYVTVDNKTVVLYMVDNRTGEIFGAKSETQVNKRRTFGTLDTIDQWTWDNIPSGATPLPNTEAHKLHTERETAIKANYKRRGRPRKAQALGSK